MAQKNSLEEAIQKMIDDVETVAEVAGKLVMKKVQEDFEKATKNVIDEYYDYKFGSYTKYGRQYNLYNIYSVNSEFKKHGKNYTITTNVHMDSSALEGVYHSNSSRHHAHGPMLEWKKGGDVKADYVFENFLEGEHPWTKFLGDGKYKYGEKKDKMSPKQKLNQYINKYEGKYFNDYMTKTIARLLELYM